jgi:hypothetical protein
MSAFGGKADVPQRSHVNTARNRRAAFSSAGLEKNGLNTILFSIRNQQPVVRFESKASLANECYCFEFGAII